MEAQDARIPGQVRQRLSREQPKQHPIPVIVCAYAALPPVIVCATSDPSSCAQRSVVDGAMQTQDLNADYNRAARSRISAASNEELPRRIRDDGWVLVGRYFLAVSLKQTPPVILCAAQRLRCDADTGSSPRVLSGRQDPGSAPRAMKTCRVASGMTGIKNKHPPLSCARMQPSYPSSCAQHPTRHPVRSAASSTVRCRHRILARKC